MIKKDVELILDLRRFSEATDTPERIESLWRDISTAIVGKSLITGNVISINQPSGIVDLWIANANGISQVKEETDFQVVDVLRNPKLLYQCIVCGEYGPLRCISCEEEGKETRLCSKHAHIIKDELSAYCPDHLPTCNCRNECHETAIFRCRSCAGTIRKQSLFGQHFHRTHPKDPDIDYCNNCYKRKFERCQATGCNRIGRSKCSYQTRNMEEPCNSPSCTDHSYQWKIWGPHNRGVTLCERHKGFLGSTEPEDLIFMIITARAPFARRGRFHFMPNPYRLRRLINRNRTYQITFSQLEITLKSIEQSVQNWGRGAERNYGYLLKSFEETLGNLDNVERELFDQVRSFYNTYVGFDAASQITGLQIQDRYFKPGQKPKYSIQLSTSGEKRYLIGRGGVYINSLRDSLNLDVDLD